MTRLVKGAISDSLKKVKVSVRAKIYQIACAEFRETDRLLRSQISHELLRLCNAFRHETCDILLGLNYHIKDA